MNIFGEIKQGDSATWTDVAQNINSVSYDSSLYTLKYELRGPSTPITLTSSVSGTGWSTSISTMQSETMTPGTWWWAAFLSATGIRITAGQGELLVTPDIATQAGVFDGRSIAEVALAAAEAALASFTASNGKIKRYTIGSRSMEFATVPEILQVISYWKIRVQQEIAPKNIAQGLGDPRRLYVRFTK